MSAADATQATEVLARRMESILETLAPAAGMQGHMLAFPPGEGGNAVEGGPFGARYVRFGAGPGGQEPMFPGPVSAAVAYARVREAAGELVSMAAEEIEYVAAALIEDPKVRAAALDRPDVVKGWPWPDWTEAGWLLQVLLFCVRGDVLPGERVPVPGRSWHGQAAVRTVYEWAAPALSRENLKVRPSRWKDDKSQAAREWHPYSAATWRGGADPVPEGSELWWELSPSYGEWILERIDAHTSLEPPGAVFFPGAAFPDNLSDMRRFPERALELLWCAQTDVNEGQRKPDLVVMDARRVSGTAVRALSGVGFPKEKGERDWEIVGSYGVVATLEGRQAQLALPMEGFGTAVVDGLRKLIGSSAVRHWCVLQDLWSRSGMTGATVWTLDAHIAALNLKRRLSRKERIKLAREVELMSKLTLVFYGDRGPDGGTLEVPLFELGTRHRSEPEEGTGERFLKAMRLKVNPDLYRGVRDPETGKLGTYRTVAPALCTVSHRDYPHIHSMGLLMAYHFRHHLEDPPPHEVRASTVMAWGDMSLDTRKKGRVWRRFTDHLDKLVEIGLLARWEWKEEPENPSSRVFLWPHRYINDRMRRGLWPALHARPELPQTGAELVQWRETLQLTQRDLAERLGSSVRTVRRWEREDTLSLKAVELLRSL